LAIRGGRTTPRATGVVRPPLDGPAWWWPMRNNKIIILAQLFHNLKIYWMGYTFGTPMHRFHPMCLDCGIIV
jgi:hypothetical protein